MEERREGLSSRVSLGTGAGAVGLGRMFQEMPPRPSILLHSTARQQTGDISRSVPLLRTVLQEEIPPGKEPRNHHQNETQASTNYSSILGGRVVR